MTDVLADHRQAAQFSVEARRLRLGRGRLGAAGLRLGLGRGVGSWRQVGFELHGLERAHDVLRDMGERLRTLGVGGNALVFTAIDFGLNGFLQLFKINSHYLRLKPVNSQYMLI